MLDFPNSPSVSQTFVSGGTTWTWDGTKWVAAGATGASSIYLPLTGGTLTGPLANSPITGGSRVGGTIDNAVIGGTTPAAGSFTSLNGGQLAGMRNRVINGDFRIDQRFNGALQNPLPNNGFAADRWKFGTSAGALSVFQALTPGYGGYVGFTVQTAHTPAASDSTSIVQIIEGLNIADLGWGYAGAKPVTLSFVALSTVAGTYSGSLCNGAGTRSYPFSFPLTAGWTLVSITIPGDTTGTWAGDNSAGMYLRFDLGSGSTWRGAANSWQAGNFVGVTGAVNFIATASAVFQLTDVQLEAGSVATPFERRLIGAELQLCQRYYQRFTGPVGGIAIIGYSSAGASIGNQFLISPPMRIAPTIAYIGTWTYQNGSGLNYTCNMPNVFLLYFTATATGYGFAQNPANGGFDLSAEL